MKYSIYIVLYGLGSMFVFIILFDFYFSEVGRGKEYCVYFMD